MRYQVKVYLGETRQVVWRPNPLKAEVSPVNLFTKSTAWTFLVAQTRRLKSGANIDEPVYSYQQCTYIDGTDWPLEEINGFVGQKFAEMPAEFATHTREFFAVPIYNTRPRTRGARKAATSYSYGQMMRQFPLAEIYGGAYIDGQEFVWVADEGRLVAMKFFEDQDETERVERRQASLVEYNPKRERDRQYKAEQKQRQQAEKELLETI